jgi:uncharacterized protein DUF2569
MSRYRGFATYMEFERGFHGWLVFFFVTTCLAVLVRAFLVVQAAQIALLAGHMGQAQLVVASLARLLIEFLLLAAMLYGLRLFLHEDRRTPTYWAAFFLISVPGTLASYALLAVLIASYQNMSFGTAFWETLSPNGLPGIAVYLVWALYWMRSKRVRLTYGAGAFESLSGPSTTIAAPAA